MFSPNRREFMQYGGAAAAGGFFGLPQGGSEFISAPGDELDKATPSVYLDIPGIPGESKRDGTEGTISAVGYHWQLENPKENSGRDHRHRGHVTVLKAIDKATPLLYQACATDRTLPEATVTLTRPTDDGRAEEYFVHRLEQVSVASVDAGQHGTQTLERCVLSFERCVVEYAGIKPIRLELR